MMIYETKITDPAALTDAVQRAAQGVPEPVATATVAGLFARLEVFGFYENQFMDRLDRLPISDPAFSGVVDGLTAVRGWQKAIETELRARFAAWSGGVSLADFAERLA